MCIRDRAKRLKERKTDPLKQWKLGTLDKKAQELWDTYTYYIDKMLKNTHKSVPWVVIKTDDKYTARLTAISYLVNELCTENKEKYDESLVTVYK